MNNKYKTEKVLLLTVIATGFFYHNLRQTYPACDANKIATLDN